MIERINLHNLWVETAGRKGKQLSLDETDMRNISFDSLRFEQGYFSECNFSGMHFEDVDFYNAEFYSCDFFGCTFTNCNFRKATLDYSQFKNAVFSNCAFPRTDAYCTQFTGGHFLNCSFVGINLMEAILDSSTLELIDMDGAYLDQVSTQNAVFQNLINTDSITHISIIPNKTNSTQLLSGADALEWMERTNHEGGS